MDHTKLPHLVTKKYMWKVYYEETGVTTLETMEWVVLKDGFLLTFRFEDGFVSINEALQEIKEVIFKTPMEFMEWTQPD